MSDCPQCDNVGWTDEYAERWDADGNQVGSWYRLQCRNWRHRCRPTLEEIATALRNGMEPPHSYMIPESDIPPL